MDWFPGWASVAGAHWWRNFYFGASIAALILLGVAEASPIAIPSERTNWLQ
jgi:hypothetical protein